MGVWQRYIAEGGQKPQQELQKAGAIAAAVPASYAVCDVPMSDEVARHLTSAAPVKTMQEEKMHRPVVQGVAGLSCGPGAQAIPSTLLMEHGPPLRHLLHSSHCLCR